MILVVVFVLVLLFEIKAIKKDIKGFKDSWFLIIPLLFSIVLLGHMFKLKPLYLLYLSIMGFISSLLLIYFNLQYMAKRDNFYRLTDYLLRLSNYYRIYQKAQTAYEKAGLDYDLSPYHQHYLVKSLLEIMQVGETVSHDKTEYQLKRIEYDIEKWIQDTRQYQLQEKQHFQRLMMLIGFSLAIIYLTQKMLHHILEIHRLSSYQNLIFIFLSSILIIILISSKRLTKNWILKEEYL